MIRCTTEFMLGMFCWRLRRDVAGAGFLGRDTVLVPATLAMAVMTLSQAMDMAFLVLSCAVVIGFSFERSLTARAFASPVPRWLGTISFSLYLWHIPMLQLAPGIVGLMEHVGILQPWLIGHLLLMLAVLAVSAASFKWVERPAQRWLQPMFAAWLTDVQPTRRQAEVTP